MLAMGRNKIDADARKGQAQRISALIEKSGLQRQDIAKYVGVDRSAVTLWCQGQSFPRKAKLKKLAHILQTTDGYIKTGEDIDLDEKFAIEPTRSIKPKEEKKAEPPVASDKEKNDSSKDGIMDQMNRFIESLQRDKENQAKEISDLKKDNRDLSQKIISLQEELLTLKNQIINLPTHNKPRQKTSNGDQGE